MTRTAIGTVCSEEQAEELDRERAPQKQTANDEVTQEVWAASRWDHSHATADATREKYPDIWEEVEQRFLGGYYCDDFAAMIVERADQAGYNSWSLADHIVGFIEERVFEYEAT